MCGLPVHALALPLPTALGTRSPSLFSNSSHLPNACPGTQALRDKGIRVMNVAAGNVGATAMAKETGKQGECIFQFFARRRQWRGREAAAARHVAGSKARAAAGLYLCSAQGIHAAPALEPPLPPLPPQRASPTGSQGEIAAEDVAEACLLPWHCSANCVPEEIVLKAVRAGAGGGGRAGRRA